MYRIIGVDGQQYGPVTAEQLREWIKDGRANAQTQVQAEGSTEWKPLGSFAEFSDALGAAPQPTPPPAPFSTVTPTSLASSGGRDAAIQALKGPAIALKVTAILGLVAVTLGLIINVLTLAGVNLGMQRMGDPQFQRIFSTLGGGVGIIQDIIGAAVGVVILMGAAKMRSLQNYQFAFTACILAIVPCVSPCCFLGLPFGIWALTVLSKPHIKSQFS